MPHPAIAIVVSRYNRTITDQLLAGAEGAYVQSGGGAKGIAIVEAPGAFETVALSYAAADSGRFDGVLALGCIIKGDTKHDEYLGHAVTQGLANVSLITGVPVGLGVLTVNTVAQAKERAGMVGKKKKAGGNKGAEAMNALLMTIAEIEKLGTPRTNAAGKNAAAIAAIPDKARSGGARS